jgi:nucleoside diphosphate kinase
MPKQLIKLPDKDLEAHLKETTFIMCKPEAVLLGRHGEILDRINDLYFATPMVKMFSFTKEAVEEFYGHVLADYEPREDMLASFHKMVGMPTLGVVVQGPNSIATMRKLAGGLPKYEIVNGEVKFAGFSAQFDPTRCPPGTIRGDMSSIDPKIGNTVLAPVANFMHASDSPESYQKEMGILRKHKLVSDGDFIWYERPEWKVLYGK